MTKRFLTLSTVAATVSVLLLANPPSARALPTLFVSDGTTSYTIGDNGSLDSDGGPGSVVFSGSVGPSWFLVITVGQTKPVLGSAAKPILDLFTIEATSSAGGSLWVKFSENGFVSTAPTVSAAIGGTTDGTVTYKTYEDPANVVLAQTVLLTSQGPFGPGSFSGEASAAAGFVAPYSLTQWTMITHTADGFTSFDANLQVPDGGLTVGLLGVALLGLEALRRVIGKRPTYFVATNKSVV